MENQTETNEIQSESRLTFMEATSIIVGHGVGAGILAVPYLASRAPWWDFLWILAVAYAVNLILHLMIAELSLNNIGAQFVKCFENELFTGRFKKIATWIVFGFLAFSVLCNVASFITGSAAVFTSWFGLPSWAGMLIYYFANKIRKLCFYIFDAVGKFFHAWSSTFKRNGSIQNIVTVNFNKPCCVFKLCISDF